MPPVMGAAAFLMVEYVGITYTQVMKHAFLPAMISYIALFYIVHLEALKSDIRGIPRRIVKPWQARLASLVMSVSGFIILAGIVYYGLGWIKQVAGPASLPIIAMLMLTVYVLLIRFSAHYPELHMDDPNQPLEELPDAGPTLKSGLHFLLPVVVLIWNLMVEELSPALSAFWAICFLMFILVTQRPLFAFFRGHGALAQAFKTGWHDLYRGLASGARNMVAIGIATAAAGIIVGTVTLTGIGLVLTDLVEAVSGGNLMIMLFMVAVVSLILGMGLPTTANYIVVSTLMAPVVVEIGAQSGLVVPLIAVHMFVFYFGLMADVTPPVGLASYAAAGIAKCDPIKTGVTAFGYSIRTAILPFMFIFNTQLLMIGIDSWLHFLIVVSTAIIANLMFAAATQGWFLVRNRWWESALLLLVCFSLFRPEFWWDKLYAPYQSLPATQIMAEAEKLPANANLRIWVEGLSLEGEEVKKGILLPLGPRKDNPRERLADVGISVMQLGDAVQISTVKFGSRADKLGLEQGFNIVMIEEPSQRPDKEWVYVPTLALLGLIVWLQRRRQKLAPA
jgi:TRAP transporter 4TM/12TM fusion protein